MRRKKYKFVNQDIKGDKKGRRNRSFLSVLMVYFIFLLKLSKRGIRLKKKNKFTSGFIVTALLSISIIQPINQALAKQIKPEQVGNVSVQKEQKLSETNGKVEWDRSSLLFIDQNENCSCISATIKNGQDSRVMQGEVKYEVYWSAKGNPKNGELVYSGSVASLNPGETKELTYVLDPTKPGNYMFKAYQRPGHPGKGELWSESITVKEKTDYTDLQRPLDQLFHSSVENATATFTIPEGMDPVVISFSSYVYPEGTLPQEDGKPYEGQKIYDTITNVYGPGTYTITVDIPENGLWQSDLYLGCVIEELSESGHPIEKIIDADYSWKE